MTTAREALFWSHVDQSAGPTACWPWAGHRNHGGYGITSWHGRRVLAHRIAWTLTHGAIRAGHVIRHRRCDNPPCCNPAHLAEGTHADNSVDQARNGRSRLNKRGPQRISDADVLAIRARYRPWRRNQPSNAAELAAEFQISRSYVGQLVAGYTRNDAKEST